MDTCTDGAKPFREFLRECGAGWTLGQNEDRAFFGPSQGGGFIVEAA
ncbi:MAG TPA: hypothetical protein VHT03_11010 [Rhizomicrobium sp.]|jgi:hypothetical protein|nr:hypothetical protein [Rhizomicrobium sp.]